MVTFSISFNYMVVLSSVKSMKRKMPSLPRNMFIKLYLVQGLKVLRGYLLKILETDYLKQIYMKFQEAPSIWEQSKFIMRVRVVTQEVFIVRCLKKQ